MIEAGIRFVCVAAALLVIGAAFGERIVAGLLPLYRAEIEMLVAPLRIVDVSLAANGADTVLRAEARLPAVIVHAGRARFPDPQSRVEAATLAGHVMQTAILFLSLLAAWPCRGVREAIVRGLLALPLLAALLMADVPLVLAGELHQAFGAALASSPGLGWAPWSDFLQGGGRYALALALGVCAIHASVAAVRPRRARRCAHLRRQPAHGAPPCSSPS